MQSCAEEVESEEILQARLWYVLAVFSSSTFLGKRSKISIRDVSYLSLLSSVVQIYVVRDFMDSSLTNKFNPSAMNEEL